MGREGRVVGLRRGDETEKEATNIVFRHETAVHRYYGPTKIYIDIDI
jgi:hypothetical protein